MIATPLRIFGNLIDRAKVVMGQNFLVWSEDITNQVNNNTPETGTGSPEGVVSAPVGRFYIDTNGLAGSVLYVKRDSDVGGDASQGWILV